jgi:SAM-dependent methyltransferase
MKRFPVKRLEDGRAMLNLACGGRMHSGWNNVDFSPLVRLARHPRWSRLLRATRILSDYRYGRLRVTEADVICWDLRQGVPFDSDTFDVVYHSHFLEHLEREAAQRLLDECHRVVKRSGVLRVAVPDLESLCRDYLESCDQLRQSPALDVELHERTIEDLIAPLIVTEPSGTRAQPWPVRLLERWTRGNSAAAGEAHRWMYDRITIGSLLQSAGFTDIRFESHNTGRIKDWPTFGLDSNADGAPYKLQSLYVEATK